MTIKSLSPKKRAGKKRTAGGNPNIKGQLLKWGLKLLVGGAALAVVFVLLVYMGLFGRIPDKEAIQNIRNHTASVVYSADGAMVGKYYIQNRLTIDNDNISIHIKNALIATEDSRFFEHKGLDFVSLGRVFVKTILLRDTRQGGGSTISQQLAKNLYPRRKIGLLSFPVNKIREIFIAARLEKQFSKEEILGLYLNTVPFGEDIYGIEVAANRFFGKPSARLNPSEAATLVGMLAANTAYNPQRNPERSMQRRNVVLDRMQANGFLSEEECDSYKKAPIKTSYTRLDNNHGPAPWFMEQVRMQTESILKQLPEPQYNIYTDGLRIHTTIDSRLQTYAVAATKAHLAYLQNIFEEHWKNQDPWQHNPEIFYSALRKTDPYQLLKAKGLDEKAIMDELNKTAPTTIYTHEGEKHLTISPIDSLKRALRILHTGFVAMDPSSGHILSWVGGVDFKYFKYDHVTTRRQVGSTFKPLVYATALNQGYDPCEYITNEQRIYERFDNWQPSNADGNHDGYYSMKGGLIHSVNTIAAQVIDKTGVNSVISTARAMGITSPIPTVPSIALGTADISLLEMVTAYTAFANYGRAKQPVLILKIEDARGKVLYEAEPAGFLNEAFNEETARMMVQILREVVEKGTGSALYHRYHLQGDYAGKTGTTQNNADGWFIGFTPNIVAGAWVGASNPGIRFRTTALGQGAHTALPIFARFMQKAEQTSDFSAIRTQRFYPLPGELMARLDCEDYLEDYTPAEEMNFFERLFSRPDRQGRPAAEEDSTQQDRDKNLLNRMRDIFRKKE